MLASSKGHTEIVKTLITNNADLNVITDDSQTALMEATYFGYIDIIEILLMNNADVNIKFKDDRTALDIAIEKHGTKSKIVNLLIKYGAKKGKEL